MDSGYPAWASPVTLAAVAHGQFGPLVRAARLAQGLTLAEAAARCGYSGSWLSRIETGKAPAADITVLRRLSRALDIPPVLFGLIDAAPGAPPRPLTSGGATVAGQDSARRNGDDPVRRRKLLAGLVGVTSGVLLGTNATAAPSNALSQTLTDVLLNPFPLGEGPVTVAGVRAAINTARADHQACRYAELTTRLPGLIRNATAVRHQAGDNETCAAEALLADAYGLAAHLAIRLRDDGLAWICLDRGLRSAHASGDPLIAADTQRWSAVVLRRSVHHRDRAQQVVISAADQLAEQTGLSAPEHASAFAALRATAAYTAAIQNDRATALDLISEAEHACRRQSPSAQSRTSRQSIGFGHLDLAIYKIGWPANSVTSAPPSTTPAPYAQN